MIPASNNKVYSAIWALAVLGPDYRFPTDLLVTGPVQNGVVRGAVVIRGSGDVFSAGYDIGNLSEQEFEESAEKLVALYERLLATPTRAG